MVGVQGRRSDGVCQRGGSELELHTDGQRQLRDSTDGQRRGWRQRHGLADDQRGQREPEPEHREHRCHTRVEGTSIAVSGTATDPAGANDTLSYAWSVYKDGGPTAFASGTGANWSFTPTDNGSYEIRLTVSDEDGGSATASQTISVANVEPEPEHREHRFHTGGGDVDRGQRHGHGPGGCERHAQPRVVGVQGRRSDGVCQRRRVPTGASLPTDDGSYEIRLTASDEDGGSATASQTIGVANANPSPSIVSIGSTRSEGTSIAVNRHGDGPGGCERHAQPRVVGRTRTAVRRRLPVGNRGGSELHSHGQRELRDPAHGQRRRRRQRHGLADDQRDRRCADTER